MSQNDFQLPHSSLGDLTLREFEILLFVADDLDNAQIAKQTRLSNRTIINVRSRIGDKLQIKGHHQLGHFARHHNSALHRYFKVFFPDRRPLVDTLYVPKD